MRRIVPVPLLPCSAGLERELYQLALACMAKSPGSRPANFNELLERVGAIGEEHDILQHLVTLVGAAQWKQIFSEMQSSIRPGIIRSLLELEVFDAALEEVEDVPDELLVGDLATLRGTVLSLNNRNEAALEWFDRALSGDLAPRDRTRCLTEKALSLKRLRRFAEAVAVYDALLDAADDRFDPAIVVNLATVHNDAGQPQRAADLLRPFLLERPNVPQAWASLGIAREQLGDLAGAADAYRHTLRLNAAMAHVQVLLAGVLLKQGQFAEADSLLYAAYTQGYQSEAWLVNTLAAATLLGNTDLVTPLTESARNGLGRERMRAVERQVVELIQQISNPTEPGRPEPVEEPMESDTGPDPLPDAAPRESESISLPHFNTRYYVGESMYSIDFYYEVERPDYVDAFRYGWTQTQRDPRSQLEGMTLRGQPFYFTRCPGCRLYILTNRDIGKHTRCRVCGGAHDTEPASDVDLDALLGRINAAIGRTPIAATGIIHLLLCQHQRDDALQEANAMCVEAGLTRLADNLPAAMWLLQAGSERGLLKMSRTYSLWRIDGAGAAYSEATPPEIDRVLRRLRAEVPGVRTVSASLDRGRESHRAMLRSVEDLLSVTQDPSAPDDPDLDSYRALASGDLAGAAVAAERLLARDAHSVRAQEVLGSVAVRSADFDQAIRHFERATALDPLDRNALEMLFACYRRTGQEKEAAEVWSRLARIGGAEFLS